MREITAGELQKLVDGDLKGDATRLVKEVAPLETASPDGLSFVASARYLAYLQATRAGVVLTRSEWLDAVPDGCTAIVVSDPHIALQQLLLTLFPKSPVPPGVHPTAVVAPDAMISADASIGPFVVIGAAARIGASTVGAHAVVGMGCQVGDGVTIYPHVTLYEAVVVGDRSVIHSGARIGKPGFGFVWKDGAHQKVPQVGGCTIEEDVEVGANATIDRGSLGDVVIGAGTKIDNMVHVGHNVKIGRHVLLIAQTGIAGSTTIGDGAVLAGQSGVGGHLTIGAGAKLAAQAGAISDIPAGQTYSGYPARPHREALKASAGLFKLPELFRRLRRVEAALFGKDNDR